MNILEKKVNKIENCICLEYDDKCVTAAETYSCGREKEPGIVNLIFNTEKSNSTIVRNSLDKLSQT
jgi:hypothetical protein